MSSITSSTGEDFDVVSVETPKDITPMASGMSPHITALTIGSSGSTKSRGAFYKHYMVMASLQTDISTWFKTIVMLGYHDNSVMPCDDYPGSHYHILGEAKYSNRLIRDMSLERLKNAGIVGGQEAKDSWMAGRQRHIVDANHFKNTIEYIKKQCQIISIDNSCKYSFPKTSIFKIIDDVITPEDIAIDEMMEFRARYPKKDSWKALAYKKGIPAKVIEQLQNMEAQRHREDLAREISTSEMAKCAVNFPMLNVIRDLIYQLDRMPSNTGCCLVLIGSADTFKSTINRIIARYYGEYDIWPGSQFIQRDILKFDTPAKKGIRTIVIEEMQWVDIARKISLEKTMNMIKEQLIGAGLDVRMAKNTKQSDISLKLKLDRILCSTNPDRDVNFRLLHTLVTLKPEFQKRFIVCDMDQFKSTFKSLRSRTKDMWENNSEEMETLFAKVLHESKYMDRAEWEYNEYRLDEQERVHGHWLDEEFKGAYALGTLEEEKDL